MEENLHKDNLEEFFKNAVDRAGNEPADDGWDMPSDDIWEGINASINPPASSSPRINRKWLGAILLGIVLAGVLFYNYTLNQKIDNLTEAIEENKSQIEQLGSSEYQSSSTKQDLHLPDENVGLESISDDEDSKNEATNDRFSILDNENRADRNEAQNPELIQNTGTKRQTTNKPIMSESSGQDSSDTKTNNSLDVKNELSPSKKLPEVQQSADKKKAIATDASGIIKDTAPDHGKAEDSSAKTTDPGVSMEESSSVSDSEQPVSQDSAAIIADADVPKIDLNTKVQEETPGEKSKNKPAEIADADDPLNQTEDSLAIPEAPQMMEENPSEVQRSRKGFYIGAHLAPTYAYREIQLSNNNPLLRKLLDKQEKADYSYSFGIKTGYRFSKNWSIETGANYAKATMMSHHRKQLQHRQEDEMQNAQGFDSNHQVSLNTSYGDVATEIAITRASGTPISQYDFIGLRIKTEQDLSFVRIPLVLKYKTAGDRRLHFSARAGIMNSFIVRREVRIKTAVLERPGVVVRRMAIQKKFSGLNKSSVDMLFGIGLEYDLSNKFSLYFEPTITRSINSVYGNELIKTYPVITTLDVGASYQF